MTNELKRELEKFEEDELILRIARGLTERANHIAIEILKERGCENVLRKIDEAKASLIEAEKLEGDKNKRQINFLIQQVLILNTILMPIIIQYFFPYLETRETPGPIVNWIVLELFALPITIAILRGLKKKTIGILIVIIIILPIVGWLIAFAYSIKKSVKPKT